MYKLEKNFKDSILKNKKSKLFNSLEKDGVEFVINLFGNEFPILNLLSPTIDGALYVRNHFYIKKIALFIDLLSNSDLTDVERENHLNELEDVKKMDRELSLILETIDKTVEIRKVNLYVNTYIRCIRGQIDYEEMCEAFDVIRRIFWVDYELLIDIYKKQNGVISDKNNFDYKASRLVSLGLLEIGNVYAGESNINFHELDSDYPNRSINMISTANYAAKITKLGEMVAKL